MSKKRDHFRTLVLTLTLVLATSLGTITLTRSGQRAQPDTAALVRGLRQASAQADVFVGTKRVGSGSGTLFRVESSHRTLFITAAHVAKAGEFMTIRDRSGKDLVLVPLFIDEVRDIAVCDLPMDFEGTHFLHYARFAKRGAQEGEWIWHVGSPGFPRKGVVSRAVVSACNVKRTEFDFPEWPWESFDVTTALAFPGCSGGGVFNEAGEWVGLVVGGPRTGVTCYIPLWQLRKSVNEKDRELSWIFD